ncbi:MAG: hypothetical protein HYY15_03175 [Candidatus Omnitrophica bacterium]|nr:hypothetical protein [Candidatus Omnitrophota bacterium]
MSGATRGAAMMSDLICSVNRRGTAADENGARHELVVSELGSVESEILAWVEANGSATLRCLIRELEHPAIFVMMAVEALSRAGWVEIVAQDSDLVVAGWLDRLDQERYAGACPCSKELRSSSALPRLNGRGSPPCPASSVLPRGKPSSAPAIRRTPCGSSGPAACT